MDRSFHVKNKSISPNLKPVCKILRLSLTVSRSQMDFQTRIKQFPKVKLNIKYSKIMKLTFVHLYACSAVHSALDVGFDNGKMIGRSFKKAISRTTCSVKAPLAVDVPIIA